MFCCFFKAFLANRKDRGKVKTTSNPEALSTVPESGIPEQASADTRLSDGPSSARRPETEPFSALGLSSSPNEVTVSHDVTAVPSTTNNRDGRFNEQLSRLPREDGEHSPSQSDRTSLWEEAAGSLDSNDQRRLDNVIQSMRGSQPAPQSSDDHGPQSRTSSNHGDSLIAHVEGVISMAKKLQKQGENATLKKVLDKIVEGALKFNSVAGAAAKFDKSGYAALGWSIVSFGLQIAENAEKAREFVCESSEVITEYLTRYAEYEKHFRSRGTDKEFDSRIKEVYKKILLYVTTLYGYMGQCIADRVVRGVFELDKRSIFKKKEEIDAADAGVQRWLPIIQIELLRTIADQTPPKSPPPSHAWLKSLAFPEMNDRSKDIDPAAPGTCEWLLLNDKYRSWVTCEKGMLWIKGKPGSGKSTLLRYAFDNIMAASRIGISALVISFFVHDRGAELQKTPLGLFRSLLHQLLSRIPTAAPDLAATFEERCNTMGPPGKQWEWHQNELQDFFKSTLLIVLKSRPVWCFIDALDESGEQNARSLLKYFEAFLQELSSTDLQFRLCLSCRHYPVLDRDFPFEICLEHENTKDISSFVRLRLQASSMLHKSAVPGLITERAEGVFLWSRLVVDQVQTLELEGESLNSIQEEIDKIPPELDAMYLGLVQNMRKPSMSLRLIQWICFATRPLSLDEMRWALVVEATCPYQSFQQCQSSKEYTPDNEMMERRLKTLSCGLAETVQSTKTRVIQFIHQSVKDFFIERGLCALEDRLKQTWTKTTEPDFAIGLAHNQLSRTCIRYFTMEEISLSIDNKADDLEAEFPLFHYAVTSWIAHAKQSEQGNVPPDGLLHDLAWPSEHRFQLWTQAANKVERRSWEHQPERTALIHIAARYCLLRTLRFILQRADEYKFKTNVKDGKGRTPLSWAAFNGHEAVVRLLLETGQVEVDIKDNKGNTPLFWAAFNGHEAVMRLLLETGQVEVDIKDDYGNTPLSWAAENGHEAVVRLLLETGQVEVDVKDSEGGTPLSWAAINGHEAVIRLLLKTGQVEVNVKDDYNNTPLSWAAINGHEAVVRLLLETGQVEVDIEDNKGRTPFS